MNTDALPWILAGLSLGCYAIHIARRRCRTYSEYIEPELARIGLKANRISTAKLLNVGPFPKVEIKVGGWQSRTPIGSGEFTEYRVVDAVDAAGRSCEIWCKIEFELFRLKSIELKQNEN